MPTLSVRDGVSSDYQAIWAINAEGQPGVAPFSEAELTALLQNRGHVLVAVDADGEQAAGYCVVYRSSEEYDGEEFAWFKEQYPAFLYVDQIAVARTHRRAGVGSLLYEAVQRAAREDGLSIIACEVNLVPPNPSSLAFHTGIGFAEVGTLDTSDGRRVALLVRAIPAIRG